MKSNRALTGIVFILIGVALLLRNFDFFPEIPRYILSWTSIFILLALANLLSGNRKAALILILTWAFFFINIHTTYNIWDYWPVVLVLIGLSFLLRSNSRELNQVDDSYFDDLNVFGGSQKRFVSQKLEGGKITNIFGGSDIDLRECLPQDGAKIDVFTLFGGCKIIVPPEWQIAIKTTSIFGAFEDKRESATQKSDFKVYITGLTIFGGGEIKSSK
jgi:predicted membrane protein